MFAYCNNSPTNCIDHSGCLPIRNSSLMYSDSGTVLQYKVSLAAKQLDNQTRHERYFLTPSISTSTPIDLKKGAISGVVEFSLAHGEVEYNDIVSTTTDMCSIAGGTNVGVSGVSFDYGVYLFKESVAIAPKNFPFKIEFGVSIGFGHEARCTTDGFEISSSNIFGWSLAIIWDDSTQQKYLREL